MQQFLNASRVVQYVTVQFLVRFRHKGDYKMNIDSMSVSEYNAFLADIEQEALHDQRLFEAQCALLDADISNDCMPRPEAYRDSKRFRSHALAEARATVADHQRRQQKAATLAVRNAIAAMKSRSVATAMRMRRHFTPKRGHVSRGASLRSAAKSGDSNEDGDPDPDDQIIIDPYSTINSHRLSTPQNRISRKAILAHRGGIDKTHPRVYNWYLSRALGEIERAIIAVIGRNHDVSLDARDEARAGAWIFFQTLAMSDTPHNFGEIPNLVFFGKGGLVSKKFVRSADKLHEAVAADCRNPGQRDHRELSFELGIVEHNRKESAADIYSVSNGLVIVDAGESANRKWWQSEDTEARDKEYCGVKIKHLQPKPIKERSYHFATKVSLDTSSEDGDGSDRLELEAVDAKAETVDSEDWQDAEGVDEEVVEIDPEAMGTHFMPDTEVFNTAESDVPLVRDDDVPDDLIDDQQPSAVDAATDAEIQQAGAIARHLVLHVQRASDKDAAAQEVAEVLNQQPDSLLNQVIECLRRDLANAGLVNAILSAAGFAEVEPQKPEPFCLDAELAALAKRDGNALLACPDMYFADVREKGGYANSGNFVKLLELRVENKSGRFSPAIQKVAAILLKGYQTQKVVQA